MVWKKGDQKGRNNSFYGKHHTEESKRKIRKSNIGRHHTEESKRKMSEAKIGIHQSEETKRKRSESLKGHLAWNKGIPCSEDAKRKISESLKANPPFLGKHHTEESNEKNRLAHLGIHRSEETKKKISETEKGKSLSEEHKRKIKENHAKYWDGKKFSKEHRHHISLGEERSWLDPEIVERRMKGINLKPNKLEKKLNAILQKYSPNEWKYNGDFGCGVTIGGKIPDFINVNGRKQVIEVFGDYWHKGDDPQDKINAYRRYGFGCLVIWEHELNQLGEEEIFKNINNFMQDV